MGKKPIIIVLCLSFILQACSQQFGVEISKSEPTQSTPLAQTSLLEIPIPNKGKEHHIGIREGPSGMEFFDRNTGERFDPRGANYHRWVSRSSPGRGMITVDALFNTSFGQLDQAEAELKQMAAQGFNTVRVWKNACWGGVGGCIGSLQGGLSGPYLDNVTAFLKLAQKNNIYVIFTDDWVPDDGGYVQGMNRACCTDFDGYNMNYLTEPGISAEKRYWEDFIQGLIERNAPLENVLAYELRNEGFYEAQLPPLNRSAGSVTTANGSTYDMANQEDHKRMMEEGWLFWIEQLTNSIKAIDPSALVTMGFFVQQEPHPVRQGDTRLVYLERVVRDSQLDFFDFHAYPGYDLNIQEHAENFAMTGMEDKLIIIGEFGAAKQNFSSLERAAAGLQTWQVDSCMYGFDGWLLWTWGINPGSEFWNAGDGGGIVGKILSPLERPDPCAYGEFDNIQYNVAPKAAIKASSAADGFPPQMVADGTSKYWNASALSPQWIELVLPNPTDIDSIVLTVAQNPSGRSVHEIWVKQNNEQYELVKTFDGITSEGDVLTFLPEEQLKDIGYVKVVTKSVLDLWPAWHEIEILTKKPPPVG